MKRWLRICFALLFILWLTHTIGEQNGKRNPPSANQPISPLGSCADAENIGRPDGIENFQIELANCWSGWNALPSDWPRFEFNKQPQTGLWIQFLNNEPRYIAPNELFNCDEKANEEYCKEPWYRPLGGGKVFRVAGEGTITFWRADPLSMIEETEEIPEEMPAPKEPLEPKQ